MNERDPVVTLLEQLDRPVAPTPEFADALLEQLLEGLPEPNGRRANLRAWRPRLALPARRNRRPLLAGAVALAALAAAISAVVLSRPEAASALDVIQQAQESFASAPPFQATLHVDLNPDGTNEAIPKGATATVDVSYGGPNEFRAEVVDEDPPLEIGAPGSYVVYDGQTLGSYDARRNVFNSSPVASYEPLEFLQWRGAYPNWERVCSGPASAVLPDATIAGRDARHIRCGDFKGDIWELWIDRETGLLLKVVGQVGGDDFFLSLATMTTPKGGFEAEQVRYNPSFAPGTFDVAGPAGALDFGARLESAMAKVLPFRAVVSTEGGGGRYVDRLSWVDAQTWRQDVLADRDDDPRGLGGPGSFVIASGGRESFYNAHDNTYAEDSSSAPGWMMGLLPEGDSRYSTSACPEVGHDVVAGREAVHRRCRDYDLWIDSATGLSLLKQADGFEQRVREIEYDVSFPPDAFTFVPPPGSTNLDEAQNDPFFKTRLVRGQRAPDWSASNLDGGEFRLSDLRGKPALLFFWADWCPPGDPVCDAPKPLQQVYERSDKKVAVVWVDLQGRAADAKKVLANTRLTFPVVVDEAGRSAKAWGIQGWPFWVLLDSEGRVLDARLKPQTESRIEELLAEAR